MFDWVPNPMDWLGGDDRASVPQGPDRWKQSQQVTGPEPSSLKEKYKQRAYQQVGAKDGADFDAMSDLVGVGIAGTQAADALPTGIPGMSMGDGMTVAGVDNKKLNELLAKGNAGVYDDLMWQHMAMQEGGIDAMRKAAKAGEIPAEQMAGWEKIAAGKSAMDEAKASGDEKAISAANEQVWAGNNALLQYEQQVFLQKLVYDESPEARALFDKISPGMISPVPGGTSFINHNDANGGPIGSDADIGDKDQRWDWINKTMAPEYRDREENNHGQMLKDMRKFSANADTGLPGLPVNTEDPLDSPMPSLPDIPYLPAIGRGIANGAEAVWDFGKEAYNDPLGTGGKVLDGALDMGGRALDTIGDGLNTAGNWAGDRLDDAGSALSSAGASIVSFLSDERFKTDVQTIDGALAILATL
jgi:hypothetical protein